MDLIRFDPFREMQALRKDLSRLFGGDGAPAATLDAWTPSVDVFEDEKAITIKAELPEVKREDIDVQIEGDSLSLTGQRKLEKEEKRDNYQRIERAYGSFSRSFYLPDYVDRAKISAEYKDGVLSLTLPKTKGAEPKATKVAVK